MLRLALGLAREYHTPVPYWLALPLRELVSMIRTHNQMYEEAKERAEAAQ